MKNLGTIILNLIMLCCPPLYIIYLIFLVLFKYRKYIFLGVLGIAFPKIVYFGLTNPEKFFKILINLLKTDVVIFFLLIFIVVVIFKILENNKKKKLMKLLLANARNA